MLRALPLFALLAPLAAFAADPEPPPPAEPTVIVKPVTSIDFDTVEVNAPIQKPTEVLVHPRTTGVFPPMIRIRTDFDPELAQSVESL